MKRLVTIHVMVILVLLLTSCGAATQSSAATQPPAATTEAPAATEAPTATEAPSATEPPNVVISLPDEAVGKLSETAASRGLQLPSLETQNTVIYADPDKGTESLLTPAEQGPDGTASDLAGKAKENAIDDTMILGGLTVIEQINTELPADDYILTLAKDGTTLQFDGLNNKTSFPALIRSLPVALPRPVALITSSQMCLAWNATQICALVDTPLRADLVEQLKSSITDELKVESSNFAFERAIPDVEGDTMLTTCAKALSATPPAYAECKATVLAAPAIEDGAFAAPQEQVTPGQNITGIGVLVVLQAFQEEIFLDSQLSQTAENLPVGSYLTYEILLEGQKSVAGEPINTRVRQSGPAGDFYLPAVSGGVIIGDIVLGTTGLSNEDEAIIVNLWVRHRCFFKKRQCSWLL